ncbi:MAG TPA: adenylyltransferase/cytidyltransferase family protein [Candidatus Saccharimonadales bacterium]|jgi:glycerol-3-phosphate cytidylyltransferase/D-beta-D-heptose 7-phosphate kinase/D-beta-D-heptose 1-phosphate adenosyltransferase
MKRIIVSGYFNPLHGGHLNLIEAAREKGDHLIVVVNNDDQQMLKKGKIILDEANRVRLVSALRQVDEVVVSIDDTPGQAKTLNMIANKYPDDELLFCQGGDYGSLDALPPDEAAVCKAKRITVLFGVGDTEKYDSSTRINQALGLQD